MTNHIRLSQNKIIIRKLSKKGYSLTSIRWNGNFTAFCEETSVKNKGKTADSASKNKKNLDFFFKLSNPPNTLFLS